MKPVLQDKKLTDAQYEYLRELGLSSNGIELYGLLHEHQMLTAHQSSLLRGTYSSAEYRLFAELERLGLARHETGRPRVFVAVPLSKGFGAAYASASGELSRLLAAAGTYEATELDIIIGRQALYDRYIQLAEQAKYEIWVYAIGIAYNKELDVLQRRLTKQGISFHHIIQELKPSNYHVAHKWLRYSMRLKYLPSERGFHLMVFDEQRVVITFSDPDNTDNRLSIVTNNPQAVRMFRAQFQQLWHEALPLEEVLAAR